MLECFMNKIISNELLLKELRLSKFHNHPTKQLIEYVSIMANRISIRFSHYNTNPEDIIKQIISNKSFSRHSWENFKEENINNAFAYLYLRMISYIVWNNQVNNSTSYFIMDRSDKIIDVQQTSIKISELLEDIKK